MSGDAVISTYVAKLKGQLADELHNLAITKFADMYQLGQVQGRIEGFKQALAILTNVCNDEYNEKVS